MQSSNRPNRAFHRRWWTFCSAAEALLASLCLAGVAGIALAFIVTGWL
jgi:hypothetical protein